MAIRVFEVDGVCHTDALDALRDALERHVRFVVVYLGDTFCIELEVTATDFGVILALPKVSA